MLLTEVVEVLNWVTNVITSRKLPTQYQQLITLLTQATQFAQANQRPQLEKHNVQIVQLRNALVQMQKECEPPTIWNTSQRQIFDSFGGIGVIGEKASEALDYAMSQSGIDATTAAQAVTGLLQSINQLQQRCQQSLQSLGPLAQHVKAPKFEPGRAILSLTFKQNASINTLADLGEQAREWDYIARTFASLTHQDVESPHITDIRRGSVIIDLVAVSGIIAALSTGVHNVLASREKVLSARKLALEIKKLEMVDEGPSQTLEVAAEKHTEKALREATDKLLETHNWNEATSERNELQNHLNICLRHIAKFYAAGGQIDFRFPPDPVQNPKQLYESNVDHAKNQREIAETIRRIERLSSEIESTKRLPAGKQGPGN
jgi:hypothetical protein